MSGIMKVDFISRSALATEAACAGVARVLTALRWGRTRLRNRLLLVVAGTWLMGGGLAAAPTVVITNPQGGARLARNETVTLSASVAPSDPATTAIVTTEFFANGQSVGTSTNQTTPTVSWTPAVAGTVALTAVATEAALVGGAQTSTTSATVSVVVVGETSGITATLSLRGTTPLVHGTGRSLTVAATATAGVQRVELLFDEAVVGVKWAAPYEFLFVVPEVHGTHALSARVVDANGAEKLSNEIVTTLFPSGDPGPEIAILGPVQGAQVSPNAALTISGTVATTTGLKAVEVFADGRFLGEATVTGTLWSIAWTTPAAGTVTIDAFALDLNSNSKRAAPVEVSIAAADSPTIQLSAYPALAGQMASSTLPSGAVRNFVASITPAAGRAILRVEYFINGTKVEEDTGGPYVYRYTAPVLRDGEQVRQEIFAVRATDNAGAAREIYLPLTIVTPVGRPPAVSILTPASGQTVAPGAEVSIAAVSSAEGGTMASVQFFANGVPVGNSGNALGAAPYVATYVPSTPGRYTIDAIATDDRSNTTVSNAVLLTAAAVAPTITFSAPSANASVRANPGIPLTMTAVPVVGAGAGVLVVEFLIDGRQVAARTTASNATTGTYTATWTPGEGDIGSHVLTARVTDTRSQVGVSSGITVVVAAVSGLPPTLNITVGPIPTAGVQTVSTVNLIANAFPNGTNSTISSVEFFVNDTSVGTAAREQSTSVYRLAYDLRRIDFGALVPTEVNGAYSYPLSVYAIAKDNLGNQALSTKTTLNVFAATSQPPTVQAVAASSSISLGSAAIVTATFGDEDGSVTALQLYANGALAGTLTNPEVGAAFAYTPTVAGRYNLHVVATDDTGNTAISTPAVAVTVNAIAAPTVALVQPAAEGVATTVGSSVFLSATAAGSGTQTPTVSFVLTATTGERISVSGTRVGTTTSYRAVWVPTTADTYTASAQAVVGQVTGISGNSSQIVVRTVVGTAPTITLTAPTSVRTNSTAVLTASVADYDSSVLAVEFFINRNSVGFGTREPGSGIWALKVSFADIQTGNAEVVAIARDSDGNYATAQSRTVAVTAAMGLAPALTMAASLTDAAYNREIVLTSTARDFDGEVTRVEYFANGASLGSATEPGDGYALKWTPTESGRYRLYAIATDDSGATSVSEPVEVTVRRDNPITESSAFILQAYRDIADTTEINPIVFANLAAQIDAGTTTRGAVVANLMNEPGFVAPVQLLASYRVLMGRWPTPDVYRDLLPTARESLPEAIGLILASDEYYALHGLVPTAEGLEDASSALTATTFINQLWQAAGLGAPGPLANVQFRYNDVLTPTLGRGYVAIGLNEALAEFVTNTNSTNTALYTKAKMAALYFQMLQPAITVSRDEIETGVAALVSLGSATKAAAAVLENELFRYRYVTFLRHPESAVVERGGSVTFRVEAAGAPPLTYQWLWNGSPILGATSDALTLENVTLAQSGDYSVIVVSNVATAISDPATLVVVNAVQGEEATGEVAVQSEVMESRATRTEMVVAFAVEDAASVAHEVRLAAKAGEAWVLHRGNDESPLATGTTGGEGSVSLVAGAYALRVTVPGAEASDGASAGGSAGVFDALVGEKPRVTRIVATGEVLAGGGLEVGFAIAGADARRVLVRGVGPTLGDLSPGAAPLNDPELAVIEAESGEVVARNNDGAGDDAGLRAATAVAGAAPLREGSTDAALLTTLAPGRYAVRVSGKDKTGGACLVEIYLLGSAPE